MESVSATLAAASLLVLRLENSDVGDVCYQRYLDAEVDVEMTFFHSHTVCFGSAAAASERGVRLEADGE